MLLMLKQPDALLVLYTIYHIIGNECYQWDEFQIKTKDVVNHDIKVLCEIITMNNIGLLNDDNFGLTNLMNFAVLRSYPIHCINNLSIFSCSSDMKFATFYIKIDISLLQTRSVIHLQVWWHSCSSQVAWITSRGCCLLCHHNPS